MAAPRPVAKLLQRAQAGRGGHEDQRRSVYEHSVRIARRNGQAA